MTDPRENKLPKWAQELLYQERMKSVVRFPDEPAPRPDISERIGSARAPKGQWIYSQNLYNVSPHWIGKDGYMYKTTDESSFGSQVRGDFWLSREDARLAHIWNVCTYAAKSILEAQGQS